MDDKQKLGIIPRAIEQIFFELEEKIQEAMQRNPHERDPGFTVYCSFL